MKNAMDLCFPLDGDTLIFIDFRSDRMRQIVEAFGIQKHFDFDPAVEPKNIVRYFMQFLSCLTHNVPVFHIISILSNIFPANIYLSKVNNGNTRKKLSLMLLLCHYC